MNSLTGQRVTIMGLGRFGGGVGAVRFAVSQHPQRVVVTDLADARALASSIESLSDLVASGAIELHLGGHTRRDFADADVVIANPAVPKPWENEWLQCAIEHGATITTEIGLLIERLPDPRRLIGVTGSLGKSTTTAMIHHILSATAQPAVVGGNLGGSLLNETINGDAWVVLELSSAMLYWLGAGTRCSAAAREPWDHAGSRGWSPHVAVVTNIFENHTDWHGDQQHYERSKQQIMRGQQQDDLVVLGGSASLWPVCGGGTRHVFDQCAYESRSFSLQTPGEHNRANALLAARVCELAAGVEMNPGLEALGSFAGLPHRLHCVARTSDGRSFFNDSKATTPEATARAVRSFDDPSRVHLIAGGYDKGLDLAPIAELSSLLAGLYTIGQVGPAMAQLAAPSQAQECGTLESAFARVLERMKSGEILLLSPGCASWDQFVNFTERGDLFCSLVRSRVEGITGDVRKQSAALRI